MSGPETTTARAWIDEVEREWPEIGAADKAALERVQTQVAVADLEALERIVQARIARAVAAAAMLLVAAFAVATPDPASAHDFYPLECCHDRDCRVAAEGEIVEAPGGWLVTPSGERFTYRDPKVRPSPDSRFHRCVRHPHTPGAASICIFTPLGGS